MQEKYFGDIHDFYKYYFLKEITKDYSLGIHWCINNYKEEKNYGDKILTQKEKDKKEELYELLEKNRHKNMKHIKPYFPNKTKYFDKLLKNYFMDYIYEDEVIDALKTQDVIFFDPDVGIEIQSMTNAEKYKYVTYKLLVKFWNLGKSLIIYQHERGDPKKTDEKIKILYDLINGEANIITVKRDNVTYICVIQGGKHYIMKDELANFRNNEKEYKIISWQETGDI